jgi:hypothetical protein
VNNWASYTSINRAAPLNISWTGSGFTTVTIVLSSTVISDANSHTVYISCNVPGNPASFTVTTDILSHLLPVSAGAGGSFTGFALFEVLANSQVNFSATVLKTGANIDHGIFQLVRGYSVSLPIN